MRYWWLAGLLAMNAQAQSYTSDVFGIYESEDQTRASWAGERRICEDGECQSEILGAGEIYDIDALFGEKSLSAGNDSAMMLGIFDDENGNLVRSGEAVGLAGQGEQSEPMRIIDGVGFAYFVAREQAGNEYASIYTPDIQSERRFYRNVPDIESVDLKVETQDLQAQQGDVLPISTDLLQDQYGNHAPIGMATNMILQNQRGEYGFLPLIAQTQRASEVLHTTRMQGDYEFVISSAYQESPKGVLTVTPQELTGVENVEAVLEESTNVLIVDFNGVTTSLNHSVQDATEFKVHIKEINGQEKDYALYSLNGNLTGRFALLQEAFPIDYELSSAFGSVTGRITDADVRRVP